MLYIRINIQGIWIDAVFRIGSEQCRIQEEDHNLFEKFDIPPGSSEGVLIWKESDNLNIAVASHSSGGCTGYEQAGMQSSDTLTLVYKANGCATDTASTNIYCWKCKVIDFERILLRAQKDSSVAISEIKREVDCKDECGI